MHWLTQHSEPLLVLINFGMLAVWLFYAQLLFNSMRKQRRPRVLINQVKGRDLSADIIVANMSDQKIFVQLLLATVTAGDEDFTQPVTDVYIYDGEDSEQTNERDTSQGPLSPGDQMRLGTFRQVAQQVSPGPREELKWQAMNIRLVFFYGSDDGAVAAMRKFDFEEDNNGKRYVVPDALETTLRYRMWHRRKIWRWLRNYG